MLANFSLEVSVQKLKGLVITERNTRPLIKHIILDCTSNCFGNLCVQDD